MTTKMSFKEFMEQVEKHLKKYSSDELLKILINWAKGAHPAKRYEFLAKLEPLPEQQGLPPDQELLEEIRGLAERVKNGDYCNGWGWDDEIREERDWGDDSWADEVDDLFAGTYDAFMGGHYGLAKDAYNGLFEILEMGEEPGHLPGSPDPTDMIETDLDEAQACYLRAVYLSVPLENRPSTLLEAFLRFNYSIGDNLNLKSIVNVGLSPLPDFSQFLSDWNDLLSKRNGDSSRYLLREATILSGGIAGIAKLACKEGKHHPSVYVDWIKALESEKDFQGMVEAAKEGLADVLKDYIVRSEIAEGLVRAGEHLGDIETQLVGWREAFYSNPSLAYILSLLSIADLKGCYKEEIEFAIKRIRSLLENEKKSQRIFFVHDRETRKSTASEMLLTLAYLLAGRYEDAINLCKDKGPLGWFYGQNPKRWVIPFFLTLFIKGKTSYPAPNMKLLWEGSLGGRLFYDKQSDAEGLRQAMDKVFQSIRILNDERKKYMDWCINEVGYRIDAIVGEKHRGSYDKAANLLVAMAEVQANNDMKDEGAMLIKKYRQKYYRHVAFKRELQDAIARGNLFE